MSEFLNSLNATESAPAQSWAAEVAAAEAADAPASTPEPVAAEPVPEPAPAVEAAPETSQPEPEATEEHDRRVPLKALQEERQKRAEYERKLADYERQMAEMKAWAEQVQQKIAPQQQEAEPDPETDPIGALKAAHAQLRRMQEMTAQQQREAELNAIAYNSATQFQQSAPDYSDAYRYAINSRAQELIALGADQQSIPQILKREELSLIDTAVRAGRNPAEAIYQFAKARGYQGKTAAPVAPVAPVAPAAPNPALQQQKAAVAASATSGGAPASKGELSDAEFVNLKGAAFDAAWNKKFGGNKSSMFRE